MSAPGNEELEGGRRPISPLAAVAWTLTLTLVIQLAVFATDAANSGAADDLVNLTACMLLGHSVLIFLMLRFYAPASPMREALGFRTVSPVHVLLSAIAGAGLSPGLNALQELLLKRFPLPQAVAEQTERMVVPASTSGRVMLVITAVLLMPLAQELFYRGMLFGGLKRGRTTANTVVAVTLLFACSHVVPQYMLPNLVLGVVFAWLRGQSGSVASSVAAHTAYMGVAVAPMFMAENAQTFPLKWIIGAAVVAVIALGGAAIYAPRNARALAARRSDG